MVSVSLDGPANTGDDDDDDDDDDDADDDDADDDDDDDDGFLKQRRRATISVSVSGIEEHMTGVRATVGTHRLVFERQSIQHSRQIGPQQFLAKAGLLHHLYNHSHSHNHNTT